MPRPPKVPDYLQLELVRLYTDTENPATQQDLIAFLAQRDIHVTSRTIRTILSAHNARKQTQVPDEDVDRLVLRTAALFFQEGLPDDIILSVLKEEGFTLTRTAFVQLRKAHGMIRRVSWEQQQERMAQWRAVVQKELDRTELGNYGRTMLIAHFRNTDNESLQMVISR